MAAAAAGRAACQGRRPLTWVLNGMLRCLGSTGAAIVALEGRPLPPAAQGGGAARA